MKRILIMLMVFAMMSGCGGFRGGSSGAMEPLGAGSLTPYASRVIYTTALSFNIVC